MSHASKKAGSFRVNRLSDTVDDKGWGRQAAIAGSESFTYDS